ncbi:MAG: phosphodiester glycosidase family protein [Nostocoides sp.]
MSAPPTSDVDELESRSARRPTPREGLRSRRVYRRRRVVVGLAAAFALWLTWSLGGALTAPGTDTVSARLAEWGRFHGLGWAVTGMEQAQYAANTPRTGGSVVGGIPRLRPEMSPAGALAASNELAAPAPLAPVAKGALAGEGAWQTTILLHGHPAVRTAFLRPDSAHTSYLVETVWMDPSLLRFTLHPGYQVPGGTGWPEPDRLTGHELRSVLATFNSGFTMVDSQGGYWQGGHSVGTLRRGGAAMVLSTAGGLDVRAWGGGTPGPGTAAVRQNLSLLVDKGQLNPLVNDPTTSTWGKTIGNRAYVWRTAIGVRADGSVIFIVGPALNVKTLAVIAQEAGAIRAMQLDINPDWTNFITYTHPAGGTAVPHMLAADERPNPRRYLQPSTRDFVSVSAA